ncbi:MAG TPA: SRPBCC family protein [Candidatus Binatia bacterium]|jgi:uncharacterized protein YndB with AHSA1/START domain
MSKPKFVYVTYINATPDKVWTALTDGEVTKEYWGRHNNASDWKVGSAWKHQDYDDPSQVDIVGKVVEAEAPHRLVVTWSSPESAGDLAKISRVTYDIAPYQHMVRLTVTHEDLEPGSQMLRGITFGWPVVLASLKTYLETGKGLPGMTRRGAVKPE